MPSCAARGKTSLMSTVWDNLKKHRKQNIFHGLTKKNSYFIIAAWKISHCVAWRPFAAELHPLCPTRNTPSQLLAKGVQLTWQNLWCNLEKTCAIFFYLSLEKNKLKKSFTTGPQIKKSCQNFAKRANFFFFFPSTSEAKNCRVKATKINHRLPDRAATQIDQIWAQFDEIKA